MNEFQNAGYGEQQFAPQGFFGGLLGAPLGGLIGRGIGGLLGNQNLGRQIGQFAGGIGGSLLPFGADPMQQAQQQQMLQQQLQQQQLQELQQAQLAPQGWFGNLIGQVGRPLGGAIGGMFGNSGLGSTIGGVAGQLGSLLPFAAGPGVNTGIVPPQLQQQQIMQQHQQLVQHIQQLQQQLQQQQQQYAQLAQAIAQQAQGGQQGQIAPQGWFGNLISSVGQPLGGAIGGMFGNAGLGRTIGGVAGHLGGMLPFGADPVSQAYAQQQQMAQMQGNSYYPTQGMQQYPQQPTLH
jgi:hypothetical protein